MVSGKDLAIKSEIERILRSEAVGLNLQSYFDALPEAKIRRALTVLSAVYPDKTAIPNDEFEFVAQMLSNEKYMEQKNFSGFISSINSVDFTEDQKGILADAVTRSIEALSRQCTFELDSFMTKIFKPRALLQYMESLIDTGGAVVLEHFSDILRHEDFSGDGVSDEALAAIRRKIDQKLRHD